MAEEGKDTFTRGVENATQQLIELYEKLLVKAKVRY